MATISGSVLFNVNNGAPTTGTATPNIPIVLQDMNTGVGLVVLTDGAGNYAFNNVPNGDYRIVEAFGTGGGVASPGDFSTAVVIPQPTPNDPDIGSVPSPPANANNVQSLTPNTLFATVTGPNITGQNFVDGPTEDVPLDINDLTIIGSNLVTAADNGTWGSFPDGTPINTHPPTEPYPGVVPGFTYRTSGIVDGQYTISNTKTLGGVFWNLSDHTTGDETGRFQMVGGSNPGASVFEQTVTTSQNTFYLLSTWILNLINRTGLAAPQLGVRVLDSGGGIIFNQVLNNIGVDNIPTWYEVGTLFNSENNTSVTLQIYSNGPAAAGNDFVTDDISIFEVDLDEIITQNKSADRVGAAIGDTLTYTIVLENTGNSTATNMVFSDTIPTDTTFVANSVTINGVASPGSNPNPPGFSIPDMAPGAITTVQFQVTVDTFPSPNPIPNSSSATYDFVPVPGGSTITQTTNSNIVTTQVFIADLQGITKSVDLDFADCGDTLTYTIVIPNSGNTTALNVVYIDTIPNGTVFVTDSVIVNGVTQVGENPQSGVNIGSIPPGDSSTITFQVVIDCS